MAKRKKPMLKTKTRTIKELYYMCECGYEIGEMDVNISVKSAAEACTTTLWFDCPNCKFTRTYRGDNDDDLYLIKSVKARICAACGAHPDNWNLGGIE